MHANQIAPVDAALWISVGGIACLAAVECARRAADWLRERRERAFREDAGRLRRVARLRARLEEAAELAGWNKDRENVRCGIEAVRGIEQASEEMLRHLREGIQARPEKEVRAYMYGGWE